MTAPTLFPSLADDAFRHLLAALARLGRRPPQVLLLEGGTEARRLDMARWWACRLKCPQALPDGTPCLHCPTCLQTGTGEHLDMLAYDGRISNREDEENPGLIRAFNMDNVRLLKSRLRDAPHGPGKRVVILMGLSLTRDEAANALLKSLEEPSPSTHFVLLAAQREQLLPTLVSRSLCLTLPWPDSRQRDAQTQPWEDALGEFLTSGRGLFDKTGARNALDAPLAGQILLACQKALSRVLSGRADSHSLLDMALLPLDTPARAQCGRWLAEAQEALTFNVTPARVLEALAARLFVLRHGG